MWSVTQNSHRFKYQITKPSGARILLIKKQNMLANNYQTNATTPSNIYTTIKDWMLQGPTTEDNKMDGTDGVNHNQDKRQAYQSNQLACVILKGMHEAV